MSVAMLKIEGLCGRGNNEWRDEGTKARRVRTSVVLLHLVFTSIFALTGIPARRKFNIQRPLVVSRRCDTIWNVCKDNENPVAARAGEKLCKSSGDVFAAATSILDKSWILNARIRARALICRGLS